MLATLQEKYENTKMNPRVMNFNYKVRMLGPTFLMQRPKDTQDKKHFRQGKNRAAISIC